MLVYLVQHGRKTPRVFETAIESRRAGGEGRREREKNGQEGEGGGEGGRVKGRERKERNLGSMVRVKERVDWKGEEGERRIRKEGRRKLEEVEQGVYRGIGKGNGKKRKRGRGDREGEWREIVKYGKGRHSYSKKLEKEKR